MCSMMWGELVCQGLSQGVQGGAAWDWSPCREIGRARAISLICGLEFGFVPVAFYPFTFARPEVFIFSLDPSGKGGSSRT